MTDLPFHIADGIIVAVLVVSGLLAYFRGFVKEILSVAGWIGAALVALYGFPYAQPFARELIGHDLGADVATGAGLFVVTLMVLTVISHSIARGVRAGVSLQAKPTIMPWSPAPISSNSLSLWL